MYFIKTRNWHGKRWVLKLLRFSTKWGVNGYMLYDEFDPDKKFILETPNPITAWLTWGYFVALRYFSGGWTYIIRPRHKITGISYKSIY